MGYFDDPQQLFDTVEGRVEAIAKVTGQGKYSAEYAVENMCYAVLVGSTVAAGSIVKIYTDDAKASSGVIDVITHLHKPVVPGFADEAKIKEARFGLPIFHTDTIYFKGQPIAMVIANSLEEATYAASLITADYTATSFEVDFNKAQAQIPLKLAGKDRGNIDTVNNVAATIDAEYNMMAEVHNPMEMHATIAHWTSDNSLKLYDKNQGVNSVQRSFAKLFNIPIENIHVISEFVGGGFGSGLRVWPHALAAIMAAKLVNRPVKLMLTRPQMFHSVGYRPQSWQRVKLAADSTGKFQMLLHQAKNGTSMYETFGEGITRITRLVYHVDNLRTESAIVPLNLSTPTWMRGPGDCTGDFAIESAIDELSYKLQIDPVDMRLKNLALDKDPESGKPWSTHYLDECIHAGAATINWKNRNPIPGKQTEGDWQIGYGMAVGMWNAGRGRASAGVDMRQDGSITVKSAMTDIGTGTGTAMQNIAHQNTGIPIHKIQVELGNSDLPPAPSQGGSTGLSSISGAVAEACNALKLQLAQYAALQHPQFKDVAATAIVFATTGIALASSPNNIVSYQSIWTNNKLDIVSVEASSGPGGERQQYAFCSSAAHFYRVKVHSKTGKVKVERAVVVVDGGSIVNEKPAANQISGAVAGGIGMALMEALTIDHVSGSIIANDLAGYHFATNADVPIVEVSFINKPDVHINPSGAKGLGEVGIIGSAAAIANAIYNATGKRMRNLPITPDAIIMG